MTYQRRKAGTQEWEHAGEGAAPPELYEGFEYRLSPWPAALKWPQTTMTERELEDAFFVGRLKTDIANQVISHACKTGLVVPMEVHDRATRALIRGGWQDLGGQEWKPKIGEKPAYIRDEELHEALQAGARRERELGDMLYEAVAAVHDLDPHRKVRVPTPKPKVYVTSFNHGEIVSSRDMVIANNVRALCLSRQPYLVTNDELRDIITRAK